MEHQVSALTTLRKIWGLIALGLLALVAFSLIWNAGAVSELTIGLMLLAYGVIFYFSLPSSFLVKILFTVSPIVDLIGTSKHQDFYLLICMAVVGYLQWWLVIELAYRAWKRRRPPNETYRARRIGGYLRRNALQQYILRSVVLATEWARPALDVLLQL